MGGVGPGSYYLWVYLQLWLLIPFLYLLLDRLKIVGFIILLIICIALNVCCDKVGISESLYRLSCIRYIYLAVPAYMLLAPTKYKKPIICVLVVVSFAYLVYFYKIDLTPWVLDLGWAPQQWPTYFWTMVLFMALTSLTSQISLKNKLYGLICRIGENSWYIFLAQMFILAGIRADSLIFIDDTVIRNVVFIIAVIILSIIPALLIDILKVNNQCHQK